MDDEKEEYKEKIIETVNNIKDIKILIYLYIHHVYHIIQKMLIKL